MKTTAAGRKMTAESSFYQIRCVVFGTKRKFWK